MDDAAATGAAPAAPLAPVPAAAPANDAKPDAADAPPNSPEYVTVPSVQSSWGDTPQPPATAAAAGAAAGWSVIGSPLLLPRGVEPSAAAKEESAASAGSGAGSGRGKREDDKIDAEADAEDDADADADADAAEDAEWPEGAEDEDETEEDDEGDGEDDDGAAGDEQNASESGEWTGPGADSDGDDGVDVAAALEAAAKPDAAEDAARPDVKTAAELAESEQNARDDQAFWEERARDRENVERLLARLRHERTAELSALSVAPAQSTDIAGGSSPQPAFGSPRVTHGFQPTAWGGSAASQRKTSAIVEQLKSEYDRKAKPQANPAPPTTPTLRIPSAFSGTGLSAAGDAKTDRTLSAQSEPPEVPVPLRAVPSPAHGESKTTSSDEAHPRSPAAPANAPKPVSKPAKRAAPTAAHGPTPEEASAVAMVRSVMVVLLVMLCALAIAPLGLRDEVTAMRQELDAVKSWASRANDTLALHGIDLNATAAPGTTTAPAHPLRLDVQQIRRAVLSDEVLRVLHDRLHRTAHRTATGCAADPTCKKNEWFWTKWFGTNMRVDFATAFKWAKAFARERVTERHLQTLALKDLVALGLSTPQAKAFRLASGASRKARGPEVLPSAHSLARDSGGDGAAAHAAGAYSVGLEAVRAVADGAARAASMAADGATAVGGALCRGVWRLQSAVRSVAERWASPCRGRR